MSTAQGKHGDVGKVVVVMKFDGRTNISIPRRMKTGKMANPVETTSEMKLCHERKLGSLPGFSMFCLDIESTFISTGLAEEIVELHGRFIDGRCEGPVTTTMQQDFSV